MDYREAWEFANAGYNKPKTVGSYEMDNDFYSQNASVYYNPKTKKAVVSYSGTRLISDPNVATPTLFRNPFNTDIGTDLLLMLGISHVHPTIRKYTGIGNRYNEALNLTNAVIRKYGKQNVTVVGHSLGGALTMHASEILDVPGIAINPGLPTVSAWMHKGHKYNKVTAYYDPLDPISQGVGHLQDTNINAIPIEPSD